MSGWSGTLVTLLACAALFRLALAWWRSPLNPVAIGMVCWLPALVMLNWPPFFLGAYYQHFNLPPDAMTYLALLLGLAGFWAGCFTVRAMAPAGAFGSADGPVLANFSPGRALALFAVGLPVLLYAWWQSGLADLATLDPATIAESRRALHLGYASFLTLFMDIAAIALFAHALRTGRLGWCLPLLVAMAAYSLTLQKFTLVWLAAAAAMMALLQPQRAIGLLWRPRAMRLALAAGGAALVLTLFVMNDLRGMSEDQLTAASSPWFEQFYIFSGASAVMNLSATLQGVFPEDPPTAGRMLYRTVLWTVLDEGELEITRHFGGVNTGTMLLSGWSDFRWPGLFITPFLSGICVMLCLRMALRGTVVGLILGAIAMRALVFSPSTDKLFDPTTTILVALALLADLVTRRRLTGAAPAQAEGLRA